MHRVTNKYNNPGVVVEIGPVMMLMPEVLGLAPEDMPTPEKQQEQATEKLRKLKAFTPDPSSFLIQAYMKSGTHWLWEIMRMLVSGKAEVCGEMKEEYFLEMADVDRIPNIIQPTIYNTHITPSQLPDSFKELKTIYMLRNPKDVMVSSYHHVNSMHLSNEINWEKLYEEFMDMTTEDPVRLADNFFTFTKEAWERRNNPNTLLLFYEDMVQDFEGQLRKLAKFMDVPVVGSLIGQISQSTEINTLKSKKEELLNDEKQKFTKLFRKGGVGKWKSYFSEAQSENLDRVMEETFKDCPGLEFVYELQ